MDRMGQHIMVIIILVLVSIIGGMTVKIEGIGMELSDAEVKLRIAEASVVDLTLESSTCDVALNNLYLEHSDALNEAEGKHLTCQGELGSQAMNMWLMQQQMIGLSNSLDECNAQLWRSL
jgi:hypothetical protein